jgi:two-component system chemotaxis sensor kinase CheA
MVMKDLINRILEESRELLQQLEIDLLDMEKNPGEKEIINRIFRAAHTIKGSAGLVGLTEINTLAYHMEDVVDQVRSTGEPMSREKEQNNTIRVDTKRLEKVLNFVSELVISQSRVKEMVSKQNQGEMEVFTAFKEVDRIIRQLQEKPGMAQLS